MTKKNSKISCVCGSINLQWLYRRLCEERGKVYYRCNDCKTIFKEQESKLVDRSNLNG